MTVGNYTFPKWQIVLVVLIVLVTVVGLTVEEAQALIIQVIEFLTQIGE